MQKKTVISVIVIAMLLVICLYFIGSTYARYIDEFTGTGEATVAKWAVKVNGADTKEFTIQFKQEENQYVVEGLLAPDVTLKSTVIPIDLTGTEVAVDVEAKIDEGELETALADLGESKEDITTEVKVYKGETEAGGEQSGTIELPDGQAFTEDNGKFCVVVKIKWTDTSSHDTSDTAAGKKANSEGLKLNIPVKLTLKQHLSKDV